MDHVARRQSPESVLRPVSVLYRPLARCIEAGARALTDQIPFVLGQHVKKFSKASHILLMPKDSISHARSIRKRFSKIARIIYLDLDLSRVFNNAAEYS